MCIFFSKIKENKNNLSKNVIFQINFGGANLLTNLLVLDFGGGDSLPIAKVVNLGGRLVGCVWVWRVSKRVVNKSSSNMHYLVKLVFK